MLSDGELILVAGALLAAGWLGALKRADSFVVGRVLYLEAVHST